MKKEFRVKVGIIPISIIVLFIVVGMIHVLSTKYNKALLEDVAKRPMEETVKDLVFIGEDKVALSNAPSGDVATINVAKAAFIKLNDERKKNNLVPLKWSDRLEKDAAVRASEVAKKWSHKRPDGSDYWSVDSDFVYGESISKGFRTADAAINSWMNSDIHRTSLLDAEYTSVAIFVYQAKDGNWYWVVELG